MTDSPSAKTPVRMAHQVRDQLLARRACHGETVLRQLDVSIDQWKEIQTCRRRLALCAERGWAGAAGRVARQAAGAVRNVSYYISQPQGALESALAPVPSVRDIVEELRQVATELGYVACDLNASRICVTTEAIELEDVYLGPFEIQLFVGRLGQDAAASPFEVSAQEPNTPAGNSSVTHPHVQDDMLCCGDASVPIRAALEAGRLGDFFCLVRSVLETYNPSSPYVPLDRWDGRTCHDCGDYVSEDGAYWCSECGDDYCESCCSSCAGCSEITCDGCLTECEGCEERFCRECITTCGECGRRICTTCQEDAQCPCQQNQEDQSDDDSQDTQERRRTEEEGEPRAGQESQAGLHRR